MNISINDSGNKLQTVCGDDESSKDLEIACRRLISEEAPLQGAELVEWYARTT
jgi:hypothetical protein